MGDLVAWSAACEDGATVTVHVDDVLLDMLPSFLPPFGLVPLPADHPAVAGRPGAEFAAPRVRAQGAASVDLAANLTAWHRFESDLGVFVAAHLRGRIAIHAGLVLVDACCVVLPGPSFAGKSTLCRALAESGSVVLSDEYAIVDVATGCVSGWPRPMRLRGTDGAIERLPLGATLDEPVPVDVVVFVEFEPSKPVSLVPMTAGDVAVALVGNSVGARLRPAITLDAALAVAATAQGFRWSRHEAPSAAIELRALALSRRRWAGRQPRSS